MNEIIRKERGSRGKVTIGCYCNDGQILYYKMRGDADVFYTLNGWGADYEDVAQKKELKWVIFGDIVNKKAYVSTVETWKRKAQVRNVKYNLQWILPKQDFDLVVDGVSERIYETCVFKTEALPKPK